MPTKIANRFYAEFFITIILSMFAATMFTEWGKTYIRENFTNNNAFLFAGIIVVALSIGIIFIMRRTRNNDDDEDESIKGHHYYQRINMLFGD